MTQIDLKNSTVFVTGTNKKNGIGRATVDALLAAGVKKVYATARKQEQLDELVETSGGRVEAVALDVTDQSALSALGEKYSDVNIVINNAGVFSGAGSFDNPEGAALEIAVNYTAPLLITKSFEASLRRAAKDASGSAVVNIISIASLVNFPLGGTYSASKAAIHSLTQAQRRELSDSLVVGVYPGPIDTTMAEEIPFDKTPPSAVGEAIVAALSQGQEDVFPDPMSVQMYKGWKQDAKAMERQMAAPPEQAAAE